MPNYGTVVTTGGAGNLPATNELPVDMHKKSMSALVPLTPLTSILTRLGEDKAHNFRVDWQEEKEIPHTLTCATTEASGSPSTTIVVTSGGDSITNKALLFNPRTMDIRSVSASSSNSLTVAISQGGTTSAAWLSGDPLHVLSPAFDEDFRAAFYPTSVQDANVYNYEQLIRLQYALTRIMDKQSTHFGGAGSKRNQLKSQKYREFRIKWEKTLYFGGRASSGTAPDSTRMMGGLVHYLKNGTLYKDFGGLMTESGWDNYLLNYHEENPDAMTVDAFISPGVAQKISYWGKDKIRISPSSKKYGLALNQYIAPGLKVNLIELPLLNDSETRGWGFLLDPERIRLKNLDSPTFYPDAENVGQGEVIYDTYRVVTSLLVGNETRHSMFIGADL